MGACGSTAGGASQEKVASELVLPADDNVATKRRQESSPKTQPTPRAHSVAKLEAAAAAAAVEEKGEDEADESGEEGAAEKAALEAAALERKQALQAKQDAAAERAAKIAAEKVAAEQAATKKIAAERAAAELADVREEQQTEKPKDSKNSATTVEEKSAEGGSVADFAVEGPAKQSPDLDDVLTTPKKHRRRKKDKKEKRRKHRRDPSDLSSEDSGSRHSRTPSDESGGWDDLDDKSQKSGARTAKTPATPSTHTEGSWDDSDDESTSGISALGSGRYNRNKAIDLKNVTLVPKEDTSGIRGFGGTKCTIGGAELNGKLTHKLKCARCGYRVWRFPGRRWASDVDYFWVRNYALDDRAPAKMAEDQAKLQAKLEVDESWAAYACGCTWQSVETSKDIVLDRTDAAPHGGVSEGRMRWKADGDAA